MRKLALMLLAESSSKYLNCMLPEVPLSLANFSDNWYSITSGGPMFGVTQPEALLAPP